MNVSIGTFDFKRRFGCATHPKEEHECWLCPISIEECDKPDSPCAKLTDLMDKCAKHDEHWDMFGQVGQVLLTCQEMIDVILEHTEVGKWIFAEEL